MSSVKRIRQIPGQSLLSFGSLQRRPNEHKGERFCFDSFLSSNEPMANYGLASNEHGDDCSGALLSLLSPREGIQHDGHNLGDLAQLALRSLR